MYPYIHSAIVHYTKLLYICQLLRIDAVAIYSNPAYT